MGPLPLDPKPKPNPGLEPRESEKWYDRLNSIDTNAIPSNTTTPRLVSRDLRVSVNEISLNGWVFVRWMWWWFELLNGRRVRPNESRFEEERFGSGRMNADDIGFSTSNSWAIRQN